MKDKVAIITGGSAGIGNAIVNEYLQDDCMVIVLDVKCLDFKDTENLIHIYTDLSDQDSVYAAVASIREIVGKVDVLVNNARPYLNSKNINDDLDEFDTALHVLVKAPLILSVKIKDLMTKGGSIINIGSTNSKMISQQSIGYHVGKSAIHQVTKYLAVQFAKYNINVNTVSPGIVEKGHELSDKFKYIINGTIPYARGCSLDEISRLVLFLSQRSSRYITGQEIFIDGGHTLCDQFSIGMNLFESIGKNDEE
jgi:glycerol dehydrogenase